MTRCMSFNLNFFGDGYGPWSERRRRVAAAIREIGPDLIALQAVARDPAVAGGLDQASQLAADVPGYAALYRPAARHPDGREEGLAWLSRRPLLAGRVYPLSRRAGGDDGHARVLLHAVVDGPAGPLHAVNAHFSWVEAQARDNVREALAYLGGLGGAVLLAGDFNQTPTSEALARLREAGLVDAWSALHAGAPGHTFREGAALTRRIDYVLLDPTLAPRLRAARLVLDGAGERCASDHAGLVVTLADGDRADSPRSGPFA